VEVEQQRPRRRVLVVGRQPQQEAAEVDPERQAGLADQDQVRLDLARRGRRLAAGAAAGGRQRLPARRELVHPSQQ
jgi:hypothetical protein